eukprot:c11451_g1_i1.p1 GENE.c11451_g1_i1~~c11451_g1_i1.p1  ORF type:complete len:219 (-),score=47.96 c11451_g1_i1:91-747(-)
MRVCQLLVLVCLGTEALILPQSSVTFVDSARGTLNTESKGVQLLSHKLEGSLTHSQAEQEVELPLTNSIVKHEFARGTIRDDSSNSQVTLRAAKLEDMNLLQLGEGMTQDEKTEKKEEDPWSMYGGSRSLFCRIQYYHDTVEFSPQCTLEEYAKIPDEYHGPRYNCQFFEQRGVLYFYGEKWMDCTPLSQRGKKVVMECGVQCAPRQGRSEPALSANY